LLPNWNLIGDILENFREVMVVVQQWNIYLPILEITWIIFIALSFELFLILAKIVIGFIALIRGSGKPDM